MSQLNDLCPISPSGDHRYFVFKTAEVFEPVAKELWEPIITGDASDLGVTNQTYYEKKEYAILGCNCGSAIKTEVKVQ